MNKKMLIGIALFTLLTTVMMASAHHSRGLDRVPRANPAYSQYVDDHNFLRENNFRDAVKRFRYQQAMSPYMLVRSPYGEGSIPNYKPYGDEPYRQRIQNERINPFYGFSHLKNYHCHGPNACHFHNQFPSTR